MSPPTEQLIRDYLNRLSVAARGQLGPDDRRALVNRTRDFIERKTGFAGPPTAVEVARLLSGLGDPSGLVHQERQRLAAVRGEEPEPVAGRTRLARVLRRDQGKARSASWHWPVQEGSRTDLQVTLLDSSGAGHDDTSHDDTGYDDTGHDDTGHDDTGHDDTGDGGALGQEDAAVSGLVLTGTAMNGTATGSTALNSTALNSTALNSTALNSTAPNGTGLEHDAAVGANGTAPSVPAQAGEPPWFMVSLGFRGSDAAQPEAGPSKPQWPSLVASGGEPEQPGVSGLPATGEAEPPEAEPPESETPESEPPESELVEAATQQQADADSYGADDVAPAAATPAWQLTTPTESVLARRARRAARGIMSWYRRCPLEASAVVVLGIGGASYPPLWLLGAALALASRLWDYRDKWIGLTLPLLVTVIGTVLGVTRGGQTSVGEGVHEGWVYAVVVSRIAAALGASFLAWRTLHGRRPPAVPPWNRPHKIG
jgi:hypothetical protein